MDGGKKGGESLIRRDGGQDQLFSLIEFGSESGK